MKDKKKNEKIKVWYWDGTFMKKRYILLNKGATITDLLEKLRIKLGFDK